MIARHSILIVDDDPELLLLVQTVLKRIQADVTPAISVQAAQAFLARAPVPDLAIVDLMMPEISGEEFVQMLRAHPTYAEMPILVVSAKSDPVTIRNVLALGGGSVSDEAVYGEQSADNRARDAEGAGRRQISASDPLPVAPARRR